MLHDVVYTITNARLCNAGCHGLMKTQVVTRHYFDHPQCNIHLRGLRYRFKTDFLLFCGLNAICNADVITSDTPSDFRAEHSKYCLAPNFRAAALPVLVETHLIGRLC